MDKFCGECGSELLNGICPNCLEKRQRKKQKCKKIIKILLLILLGALIIGGLVVVWFLFFKGRDIDETIELYEEAVKEQDEALMLELMFPQNSLKEDVLKAFEDEVDEYFVKMDDDKVRLISFVLESVNEVDENLEQEIKEAFSEELGFKVELAETKILNIKIKYKQNEKEENTEEEVFAYRVDNKWYIYPGILEQLDSRHRAEDYQTSKKIMMAVESAIFDETINTMMKPYYGAVISVEEDLTYLPEEFQNAFYNYLDEEKSEGNSFEVKHYKNGATGYAFKISKDGTIITYISSERRIDEWQMYPTTDEDYYSDEKIEVDETEVQDDQSTEYKYVQLVSHLSPLLGYWQSDEASIYIGYNTSDYKEGFIVYLYVGGNQVYTFNAKLGWEISGNRECITFVNNELNVMAELRICDETKIEFGGNFFEFGEESREYKFEKSEISPDVSDMFVGDWNKCFQDGVTYSIAYDGGFSYQCGDRKSYDEKVEENSIVKMPTIVMYNGYDSLVFIDTFTEYPQNYDLENEIPIIILAFVIDEENGVCEVWEHDNIVYPTSSYCYKDGEEQNNFWKAMYAYEELANTQESYKQVSLIYLDDNDIPELILWETGELYTYADEGLIKAECQELTYIAGDVVGWFEYNPRSGRFSTHRNPSTYYFAYDTVSVAKQYHSSSGFVDGVKYFKGENTDVELDYDTFQQELIDNGFVDMIQPERYSSVFEAYSNMDGALDFY